MALCVARPQRFRTWPCGVGATVGAFLDPAMWRVCNDGRCRIGGVLVIWPAFARKRLYKRLTPRQAVLIRKIRESGSDGKFAFCKYYRLGICKMGKRDAEPWPWPWPFPVYVKRGVCGRGSDDSRPSIDVSRCLYVRLSVAYFVSWWHSATA